MSRYAPLPDHIRTQLSAIEPSHDGDLVYCPIRATLKSGEILDTVYVVPEKPYLKQLIFVKNSPKEKASAPLRIFNGAETL